MATYTDTTEHLALPMPHPANRLEVDVLRIRDALANIDGVLDKAANAEQVGEAIAQMQHLINGLKANQVQSVNGKTGQELVLRREDLALGPANGESLQTFAYDGAGRVQTISSTLDGNPVQTAYAYDGTGRVQTITTTYKARVRVETLAYNADGSVKNISATEAAA